MTTQTMPTTHASNTIAYASYPPCDARGDAILSQHTCFATILSKMVGASLSAWLCTRAAGRAQHRDQGIACSCMGASTFVHSRMHSRGCRLRGLLLR